MTLHLSARTLDRPRGIGYHDGPMHRLLAFVLLIGLVTSAAAQEAVHFPSLDSKDGAPPTQLDGYLFRPIKAFPGPLPGPAPAVVFLHGCGGLISGLSHQIMSREMEWARQLNAQGFVVLMVDSFTSRGSGEMCSQSGFKLWLYMKRPADAYGALAFLQNQPTIARDKVALIGWSNGGGAVLFALGPRPGKPAAFAGSDFRAAVAFYPASCDAHRVGTDWTTRVPLLILQGEKDVWTPAGPCKALADQAAALGGPIEFHAYPGAYHDFDWPNLKRKELTSYTTSKGIVPITGEDPAAHADAIKRVQAFLAGHLSL
jgi:dienelactone hydrolase